MILFTPEEWEAIKNCSSGIIDIPEELDELDPLTPEEEEELNDAFLQQLIEIMSKPIRNDDGKSL